MAIILLGHRYPPNGARRQRPEFAFGKEITKVRACSFGEAHNAADSLKLKERPRSDQLPPQP